MPSQLWIPVGIPGCGKSHWADATGYPIVSTDAIRAIVAKDVNDQSRNEEVFAYFHDQIRLYLLNARQVVADATNLRDFARERLRNIATATNAETHLVIFANPLEALMRNRRRERVVPEDVMYRMLDQYERAMFDIAQEKYTTVTKVRSYR